MRDDDDADDAVQEALWLVARRLGGLREPTLVRAWAYRIASREAIHALRRTRLRATERLADADPEPAAPPEGEDLETPVDPAWLDRLDQLPVKARLVVRLRFLEGMSQEEIAEALEIPIGTVKSRLSYGLTRLRASLQSLRRPER